MDIADCYSYRVQWSEEDGEYVGTVTEFPGLSWLDESPVDTFIGIQNVIKECVEDMRAHGGKSSRTLCRPKNTPASSSSESPRRRIGNSSWRRRNRA